MRSSYVLSEHNVRGSPALEPLQICLVSLLFIGTRRSEPSDLFLLPVTVQR